MEYLWKISRASGDQYLTFTGLTQFRTHAASFEDPISAYDWLQDRGSAGTKDSGAFLVRVETLEMPVG